MGWPRDTTHRQLTAFQEWLGNRYTEPSLTDLHLAQIAYEVSNVPIRVVGGEAVGSIADYVLPREAAGEGSEPKPKYTVNGKPYTPPPELAEKHRKFMEYQRKRARHGPRPQGLPKSPNPQGGE